MKKLIQYLYNITLRERRLRKLTAALLPCMPTEGTILDLGSGNGDIAAALKSHLPNLEFTGLDVLPQADSKIPTQIYDGTTIPHADNSFDHVMIITALHHTDDYMSVLKEARRVARKKIIIYDHQYANRREWLLLAIADWPGNVPFGVYTPFNFKTRPEWQEIFESLNLKEVYFGNGFNFYGSLAFIFGRKTHFISVLMK